MVREEGGERVRVRGDEGGRGRRKGRRNGRVRRMVRGRRYGEGEEVW